MRNLNSFEKLDCIIRIRCFKAEVEEVENNYIYFIQNILFYLSTKENFIVLSLYFLKKKKIRFLIVIKCYHMNRIHSIYRQNSFFSNNLPNIYSTSGLSLRASFNAITFKLINTLTKNLSKLTLKLNSYFKSFVKK